MPDSKDILNKLEKLISEEQMATPEVSTPIVASDAALPVEDIQGHEEFHDIDSDNSNYDDGEILNLNDRIENDAHEEEEIIQADIASDPIIEDDILSAKDHEALADIDNRLEDEATEDISDSFADDDFSDEWEYVVKEELKDFHEEDDDIMEDDISLSKNIDLDEDFGIEDELEDDFYDEDAEELFESEILEAPASVEPEMVVAEENVDEMQVLSNNALSQSKGLIEDLKKEVLKEKLAPSSPPLEDFMAEMIKPLLKEWMDNNLPALVKKIVQKEIKKLVE